MYGHKHGVTATPDGLNDQAQGAAIGFTAKW
jgi:hypothetical protein